MHVILSGELVLTQDNLHTLKTAHAFQSYPERTVWFYFMAKAESESP